ncbi:MAG: immunity 51 family protein [Raineya sp.]|jgi:tetratricopeptide (TPR) repeat protein|nr:immunity 51 family protein [Raineya sp.]
MENLIKQLTQWHENEEYEKIIEKIKSLPEQNLGYELLSHLGRAYNNIEKYDTALEIFESIKAEGENDPLWHFRVGYAYFYKEQYSKALPYFVKSAELGDDRAPMFRRMCKREIGREELKKQKMQKDYVSIVEHENSIAVCFYIEKEKPFKIGQQMEKLNPNAYMNGYNWKALLDTYLSKYHTDVYTDMNTDPEAGMYVAYYTLNEENIQKAKKLFKIIVYLVENEEKLYQILQEEADNIEWD